MHSQQSRHWQVRPSDKLRCAEQDVITRSFGRILHKKASVSLKGRSCVTGQLSRASFVQKRKQEGRVWFVSCACVLFVAKKRSCSVSIHYKQTGQFAWHTRAAASVFIGLRSYQQPRSLSPLRLRCLSLVSLLLCLANYTAQKGCPGAPKARRHDVCAPVGCCSHHTKNHVCFQKGKGSKPFGQPSRARRLLKKESWKDLFGLASCCLRAVVVVLAVVLSSLGNNNKKVLFPNGKGLVRLAVCPALYSNCVSQTGTDHPFFQPCCVVVVPKKKCFHVLLSLCFESFVSKRFCGYVCWSRAVLLSGLIFVVSSHGRSVFFFLLFLAVDPRTNLNPQKSRDNPSIIIVLSHEHEQTYIKFIASVVGQDLTHDSHLNRIHMVCPLQKNPVHHHC